MKKCEECGASNFVLLSDGWETTTDFCSCCGNKLRDKCLKCGQMERIGRPFCEEEAKEIKKRLIIVGDNRYAVHQILSVALPIVFFVTIFAGGFYCLSLWGTHEELFFTVIFSLLVVAWIFLVPASITYINDLKKKMVNKSQRAFLVANPEIKKKHEQWWNWINS